MGNEALIFSILSCFLIMVFNIYIDRSPIYPPTVQSFMWTTTLLLLLIYREKFTAVPDELFYFFSLGVLLFSVGSLFSSSKNIERKSIEVRFSGADFFLTFAAIVIVLGAVCQAVIAFFIGMEGGRGFLTNLRLALIGETESSLISLYKISSYPMLLNHIVLAISWMLFYETGKFKYKSYAIILTIFAIISAILSTGRGFIVMVLLESMIIYISYNSKKSTRILGQYLVYFLVVFFLGALIFNKGADQNDSIINNLAASFNSLVFYLVSGIPALGVHSYSESAQFGENIFRTFYAILRAGGFNVEVVPLIKDYVLVPKPTNVYTMYLQYIIDVGWAGAMFLQFCFGYVSGKLYVKGIIEKNVYYFPLAVLMYFPIVMQTFTDSYFSLLSSWIQYAFWSLVFALGIIRNRSKQTF